MMRWPIVVCCGLLAALLAGCASSTPKHRETRLWDDTRARVALQQADEQINAGHFDRARSLLAAQTEAGEQRTSLKLARIDLEEGRYAAALRQLECVPDAERNSAGFHELTAVAQEGLGSWPEASAAYARAYRLEPTAQRLVAWLDTLVLAGAETQAVETLERERIRFPGEPAVESLAARLFLHVGEHDAAIRELSTALLHDPDDVGLRQQLAEARMRAGQYTDAAVAWRDLAADATEPEQRRTMRLRWAACALAAGDTVAAAKAYRLVTLTDPDCAAAHVGLATAALADGRPAEAVQAAQRALEISPDNGTARLALAAGYARLAQPARAAEVLGEASPAALPPGVVRELRARWSEEPGR
ncbi:MAG: tetratricopeptide repeat protein [Phycisphaerae bacterium]|jgi:Tfp pilus assembly protein PilF